MEAATFCGWLVLSTLFHLMFLFSSFEGSRWPKMVFYHRIMQQKEMNQQAARRPDPVFFPHPASGIGDFGNVAVSQN